jgi:hypothetical protein
MCCNKVFEAFVPYQGGHYDAHYNHFNRGFQHYGDNYRKKAIYKEWNFIDIDDISEAMQRQAGDFYKDLIFKLPQREDKSLFFCGEKYFWWYLELTEKWIAADLKSWVS